MNERPPRPSFAQALRVWLEIGLLSFGGPTGQIALMHRELVEKRRWVSDSRFLHALNYCMLLPGPEAQQLAIYIGWLLHRTWGGIVAGALFVLPGALVMWGISVVYVLFGRLPAMEAVFYGLKPAVIAIVAVAVLRIGRRALRNPVLRGIALLAFVAIFFFKVPFPLILASAALIGFLGGLRWPEFFDATAGHRANGNADDAHYVIGDDVIHTRPSVTRTLVTAAIWAVMWLLPVLGCVLALGPAHVLTTEGLFFSKAALVTFGGAYAVLPYVAQQAVERYGWLTAPQMLDGLGLAETTPGPLILVLQFVGFLGGWHAPGGGLLLATLAAALTSWVTFVPGFLFIFAGAPFVESSRGNLRLSTALSAITAAVVGVILNLAVWFGWHVILPAGRGVDGFSLAAAILFFIALQKGKWGALPLLGVAALAGLIWKWLPGMA
jgi:chromate transporter